MAPDEPPKGANAFDGVRSPHPIGLPHPLVQDDRVPGPRRLSEAELEEIERLIQKARHRSDPINLLLHGLCYISLLAAHGLFQRSVAIGIRGFLVALVTLRFGHKAWEHFKYVRLRKELCRGKADGQVIGFPHDGKRLEALGPGILWTIDGKPSRFRTNGPL